MIDSILARVKDQLRTEEGYRKHPYKDEGGVLSVGYGRNLDATGIRLIEAEYMLGNDVAFALSDVLRLLPWARELSEARLCVLVDMAFNLGIYGLLAFQKMLAACRDGNFEEAARQMLDSKWASQVKGRAIKLSEQMKAG